MQSEQDFNGIARAIISITDFDLKNKQQKQNEQSNSEQTTSLTDIVFSLESLLTQILMNSSCKNVIQIPKLLQSLTTFSRFKLGSHFIKDIDRRRLEVRSWSRYCLHWTQVYRNEQIQSDLANFGYGRVTSLLFSTAGGNGKEKFDEINDGLIYINYFLRQLHEDRNNYGQPFFQPLPLLIRNTEEQIEEEGANEEIEAQMNNDGYNGLIKIQANLDIAETLNRFIRKH
ncbi:MAG: hypothetical protein EZS28_019532 [Streblomastix strix]|uniref:Uncharacterized protein n=1 Tax=Streblomastix strix TaxID=222440 RepID=A0A5J4VRB2_9EUKA|nr:MAG: hypothetical protein EZS28_019532 [Streblomastix strix]